MHRPRLRRLALVGSLAVFTAAGSAAPALGQDSTGVIAGHLTDGGVPVSATTVFVDGFDSGFFASTTTDDSGAFSIADIPVGSDYVVSFVLGGGLVQYFHQQLDQSQADHVTVADGATTTVDETVIPHGGMTGHVTNADGTPAQGVQVTAAEFTTRFPFVQTQTDADGGYTLPVVPGGDYLVTYQRDFTSPAQYANGQAEFGKADPIHVTDGAVTTEDETLLPTGTITGTVTDHGQALAGVFVDASSDTGMVGSTQTADDGTYRINLFPGTYTVVFHLPNGLTQFAHEEVNEDLADPIVVAAGADTVLNETVVPTGTLAGRLFDHDGNPVPHAFMMLISDAQTVFSGTDDSGVFQIPAFAGTYRVVFETGFGRQWAGGSTTGGQSTPVVITADQTTTLNETLAATGSITVTATDSVTHAAVQSFCAGINGVNDICTTDGTVSYPALLPGLYGVEMRNPGEDQTYMFQVARATVTSGANTAVPVVLDPAASVSTTIVDAKTGAPVANACLELVPVTRPALLGAGGEICGDAAGHVTLDHVGPGSYKAFASVSDGVHGDQWVGRDGGVGAFDDAQTVTVTAGAHLTLPTVKLDKAGRITGTVTDATTGRALANDAIVGLASFVHGAGAGRYSVFTDGSGRYTLTNLGPYAWTLFFSESAHAAVFSGGVANREDATGVKVKAGSTTTYNLALKTGTTVTGTVTSPDGSVSHSAQITFLNAETGEELDASQIFQSPFTYTVQVAGPQKVKIHYDGMVNGDGYSGYVGGSDFAHATVFSINGTGSRTINVTMTDLSP